MMQTLAQPPAKQASRGRCAWIVAGAIAAVWLPLLAPLASEWFEHDEYRVTWLHGLYWRPGALLAAALLVPFESVDARVYQVLASFLALALCATLAALAVRSRRAGIWMLCGGAALSLAHAFLLAFMATHG